MKAASTPRLSDKIVVMMLHTTADSDHESYYSYCYYRCFLINPHWINCIIYGYKRIIMIYNITSCFITIPENFSHKYYPLS